MNDEIRNGAIFPAGDVLNNPNFTGKVFLNMLTPFESDLPVANVTFEPGCINSWHSHAGGQILLVTGGEGYYQEWGKDAQKLKAGDVVQIPAEIKHWHGATKDSWFAHLAIELHPEKGPATWMEPVADEIYDNL